jgi:PadR family transcriptional regulator PadR
LAAEALNQWRTISPEIQELAEELHRLLHYYAKLYSVSKMTEVVEQRIDRSQLLKGVLDLAVLSVLSVQDGYGYDVVRRLRQHGLLDVAEASVYGTLRRLFATGLLTSYVVPSEEGPHRKYYGMTPVGHEWLIDLRNQWGEFRTIIDSLADTDNKGIVQ